MPNASPEIDAAIRDLSYPIMGTDAAVELHNVRIECLDESVSLGEYVSSSNHDWFESAEDLYAALSQELPDEVSLDVDVEDR